MSGELVNKLRKVAGRRRGPDDDLLVTPPDAFHTRISRLPSTINPPNDRACTLDSSITSRSVSLRRCSRRLAVSWRNGQYQLDSFVLDARSKLQLVCRCHDRSFVSYNADLSRFFLLELIVSLILQVLVMMAAMDRC